MSQRDESSYDPDHSHYHDHHPEPDSEESINPREKPMGFFEHLEELRWTLVKSAIAFLVAAVSIGYFLKEFNHLVMWPLLQIQKDYPSVELDLGTTTFMEPFSVMIQLCTIGGLLLASPLIIFFFGQFVAPALTAKEIKMVAPVGASAVVLFLSGAAFSFFFLVPSTLKVAVELNQLFDFTWRPTPAAYYSLLSWFVLGVGACFEFPLLIVLAVYIGVLEVATLRKYRRHAIIGIFVIAAFVTPTPDPFVQTMFAAPLYILYEIAILAGSRITRRRAQQQQAED